MRQISKITEEKYGLDVKFKHKDHKYHIEPFLDDVSLIKDLKKITDHSSLVVYNTEENFKYALTHWKEIVGIGRHFSLYFVNPFSKTEKKWIVFPQTHDQISEGQKIKDGLKSLSESVCQTTQKEVLEITK
ncbi:hypothetical protein HN419_00695 [Candidatus Woesearchaeota archaeon]|jgi:hypothetical protein|nr:hypothetical protein [Candidatus Woesearchaeota archaeon]MBT3537485.1 hypothetical protein [Candidatus Woesearchaeota archaeon]MBT4697246.1 hypothetical protein [Candidatus Woesearchaeota archaeon]MBT4717610.1 hypothetical protein [Candidatus Woesearchaeota archaeon]MBT7106205.1 hypothetical protein [Candidatus Woesearchaeota archaeon]